MPSLPEKPESADLAAGVVHVMPGQARDAITTPPIPGDSSPGRAESPGSEASSLDDDPGVDALATAVATSAAEAVIRILDLEDEVDREDLIREIESSGVHEVVRLLYRERERADRAELSDYLARLDLESMLLDCPLATITIATLRRKAQNEEDAIRAAAFRVAREQRERAERAERELSEIRTEYARLYALCEELVSER